MRAAACLLALAAACAAAQERSERSELIGTLGSRTVVMNLYATARPDGAWRVTGDYLLLPVLQQRYLEGERSKQLGVTFLKEGDTPILYGREPTATLQGTWSRGSFSGNRYGPGGQQRERFKLTESFPAMDGYSATVRCELAEGRYASTLAYRVGAGRLKRMAWGSRVGDHSCALPELAQQPMQGGLQLAAGKRCRVTLRDLGEFVRVAAEDCAEFCGSQGYLEPVLVDRRGACLLLRPQR